MRLRSIGAERETACIRVGEDGKFIDGPRQHDSAPEEKRVFS
jgi:hypothetical protein